MEIVRRKIGRPSTKTLSLSRLSGIPYAVLRSDPAERVRATEIAGLCVKCELVEREPNRSRCADCAEYQRKLTLKKAAKRMAESKCPQCGEATKRIGWRCDSCRSMRGKKRPVDNNFDQQKLLAEVRAWLVNGERLVDRLIETRDATVANLALLDDAIKAMR